MAAAVRYVALLRGINVGGHNVVPMTALRAACEHVGFVEPRTLLQSGNVVFSSDAARATIGATLAAEVAQRLAFEIDVVVRSAAEWRALIAANPFAREAHDDPGHLVVMSCRTAASASVVAALERAIVGREAVRAVGANLYVTYPDGQGRSKLTNAVIEKALGTRGTARNWNTVVKIAALLEAP